MQRRVVVVAAAEDQVAHDHVAGGGDGDALRAAGIAYEHMPGLGGLRHTHADSPNKGWRNASFRGYADYMQTEEFEEGLEELIAAASETRIAIMCAEGNPYRCHRNLVADALTARGIPVYHISSRKTARLHRLTPFARVENGRVSYPEQVNQSAEKSV